MKNLLFILFLFPVLALAQTTISTNQIRDAAVTYVKVQQIPGLTLFGRSANTTGVGGSITATATGQVLRYSGTTIGFGALDLSDSDATTNTLSFSKLSSGALPAALAVTGTNGISFTDTGGITLNATGSSDFTVNANDDINFDPVDDLLIAGVAGTTGQIIGNTNGHPNWVDGSSLLVNNLYTANGVALSDRIANWNGFDLQFLSADSIEFGATGQFKAVADGVYIQATDTVHLFSTNQINIDPTDNLLLNGVAGTTGQVIGNVNGKPQWEAQVSGGHTIEEEGTPLTQRTNLNFTGAGVSVADTGGKTVVTIPSGTSPGGADTQVQFNDGGAFAGEADMAYNKTTNTLTVDNAAVDTEVYDATGWNGDLTVPTKDAVRDKIETLGGSAHVIEDEGTPVTQRSNMNFAGGGVSVSDAGGKTVVTVAGAGTPGWEFNVQDYGGCVGNGSTDCTAGFELAFAAACAVNGTVVIPPAASFYRINSTINVEPCGTGQIWVNVRGHGNAGEIQYFGPSGTNVFEIRGLKGSRWERVNVEIVTGRTGVVAFDIDTNAGAQSTSFNTFANFYINLGGSSGGGTAALRNEDCIGIRTGLTSAGGNGDISNYTFDNITVFGGGSAGTPNVACLGQYAYENLGGNTLSMIWRDGFVALCDRIYSNKARTGGQRGNGSIAFYGLGGSTNNYDFEFTYEQTYLISGGRFENGNKFLKTSDAAYQAITVENLVIHDYKQDNQFEIGRAASLHLDGVHVVKTNGGTYTGCVSITADHGRPGVLNIENSLFSLASTVAYPYTKTGSTSALRVSLSNNVRADPDVGFGLWSDTYFPNLEISGNTIDLDASDVGNVGTGEDVLYTLTIPAGTLNTDEQTLHIRAAGSNTANGNNKRLRLKWGATNIVDPGTNGISGTWVFDCQVIRISNTAQKCNCAVTALSGTHTVLSDMTSTLSSTVVIQLTGEAVANNDIVKESVKVSLED